MVILLELFREAIPRFFTELPRIPKLPRYRDKYYIKGLFRELLKIPLNAVKTR